MEEYKITLDEDTANFYLQIAKLSGNPVEQVLSDSLLKLCDILIRRILEA